MLGAVRESRIRFWARNLQSYDQTNGKKVLTRVYNTTYLIEKRNFDWIINKSCLSVVRELQTKTRSKKNETFPSARTRLSFHNTEINAASKQLPIFSTSCYHFTFTFYNKFQLLFFTFSFQFQFQLVLLKYNVNFHMNSKSNLLYLCRKWKLTKMCKLVERMCQLNN